MVCVAEEIVRKINIVLGERGEMFPRRRKSNFTAKCLNTFVAHCSAELHDSRYLTVVDVKLGYWMAGLDCKSSLLITCNALGEMAQISFWLDTQLRCLPRKTKE